MEEILIISNYYPPEKGAAANRIEQLALKLYSNNYAVSILCPLANYPQGKLFPNYKGKFFVAETLKNIKVNRLWIYPSNSKNILIRIVSIVSFMMSLIFYLVFKKTPKKIIVQSPPLLLSFISVLLLSFKNKKIILNVSDLWPSAAVELNALKSGSISHKVSLFFERFIYRKSTLILGQSHEIITHIHELLPQKKCFLYRNYPNHQITTFEIKQSEKRPIKIFYAGLLGIAQGVLEVCEKINLENLDMEFHVFGEGAEKMEIEKYIIRYPSKKIFFHGMLDRSDLLLKLKDFDIALVPLKTRIYGSVPSKIFEYSALGIPLLYFGGGEGETIVHENTLGWVAKVGDFTDLNRVLLEISKLDLTSIELMKKGVFDKAQHVFDLENQIQNLIEKDVF